MGAGPSLCSSSHSHARQMRLSIGSPLAAWCDSIDVSRVACEALQHHGHHSVDDVARLSDSDLAQMQIAKRDRDLLLGAVKRRRLERTASASRVADQLVGRILLDKPGPAPLDKRTIQDGRYAYHVGSSAHPGNATYAFCECQGRRNEMEDARNAVVYNGAGIYVVCDGHAGDRAANYIASHLPQLLHEHHVVDILKRPEREACEELKRLFCEIDRKMRVQPWAEGSTLSAGDPGATAIVVIVTDTKFAFCNLGDSRAVLSRDGVVLFRTHDHKPGDHVETERITRAGGFVVGGRVCRCLAVARAFGDYMFKDERLKQHDQMVSPVPDVTIINRSPLDEFILLACDGVWDVMDTHKASDFVRSRLNNGKKLDDICYEMCKHCVKKGSTDNITLAVLAFPVHERLNDVDNMIDGMFDGLDGTLKKQQRPASKLLDDSDHEGGDDSFA